MKRCQQLILLSLVLLVCCLTFHGQTPNQDSNQLLGTRSSGDLSGSEEKALRKFLRARERGRVGGFNLFSRADERQMGDLAAAQIEAGTKQLKSEPLIRYLESVGNRLTEQSMSDMRFKFKVIVNDDVNAMALPNGVVYVNTGLLMFAQTEAELAGVLAHEIAHVAARHATRAATRRGLWSAASLGVAVFSGGIGTALQPVIGTVGGGFAMKFSRDAEREADLLGLTYLDAAGYDPWAYVGMMERLTRGEVERGRLAKMAATHPATTARVRLATRAIALIAQPKSSYVESSSEFDSTKRMLILLTHDFSTEPERPVLIVRSKEAREQASKCPRRRIRVEE